MRVKFLLPLVFLISWTSCGAPSEQSVSEQMSSVSSSKSSLNARQKRPSPKDNVKMVYCSDNMQEEAAIKCKIEKYALENNYVKSGKDIEFVEILDVEWPNSCLGVEAKGTFCAQVMVPGYKIVTKMKNFKGKQGSTVSVVFHTNKNLEQIVVGSFAKK